MKRVNHGMSNTRFYNIWHKIKERCLNKKQRGYENYGGRGIIICEEWRDSFINFKNDMYESYVKHVEYYGEKNTSIDRIDNDGNYEKGNCKWSTLKEQRGNQRPSSRQVLVEITDIDGVSIITNNRNEFARKFGLDPSHILKCLKGKIKQHGGFIFKYVESKSR